MKARGLPSDREKRSAGAGFVFGDGGGCDFVGEAIFAHFGEVRRGESDFGEEIIGWRRRKFAGVRRVGGR